MSEKSHPALILTRAEERDLIKRYLALKPMWMPYAANALGVKKHVLLNALTRNGIAARRPDRPQPEPPPRPHGDGWAALPAGHPTTWGAISDEPYPLHLAIR